MKISKWFIGGMILLFAILVLVEVKTPKRYNWDVRTYGHYDANPFGAKVVDSLLASSVESGYEVRPGSLAEAYDDDDPDNAILLVGYRFNDYENENMYEEASMLLEMLRRGQTVILFTDSRLAYDLCYELNISINNEYFNYRNSQNNLENSDYIDFKWKEDSTYNAAEYRFRTFDSQYSIISLSNTDSYGSSDRYNYNYRGYRGYDYDDDDDYDDDYGYDDDDYDDEYDDDYGYDDDDDDYDYDDEDYALNHETPRWRKLLIADNIDYKCVAASCNYGDGKLVLVSYPQLFTNYYVLEDGGAPLLMRILSQAGDKPIVRYDKTIDNKFILEHNKSQSPLRVFLDNKSLRWAVYLAIIAILISLFFTARRKQRVIPLVAEPRNQTIEMVKHIGLLYYRNHDNAALIREKYRQLVFELQRQKLIYLDDDELDDESLTTLAKMAELTTDKFTTLLTRLKTIEDEEGIKVRDKETKRLIDVMNKMLNNM